MEHTTPTPATTPAVGGPQGPVQSSRVSRVGRWRWLLGVVALGLALYAEQIVEQARAFNPGNTPPDASWFLFGLAAVLFVIGFWPVPRLLPAQSPPLLVGISSGRRLFTSLFVLSILAALAATPLFVVLNNTKPEEGSPGWAANNGSWLLYVLSVLLFATAFIVWERSVHVPSERPEYITGDRLPKRVEWLLMAGVFVLALVLRLSNLDSVPPGIWFDEAQNGLVAKQLLTPNAVHLTFVVEKTQMGALYFYFLGWVLEIFGATVWPLRLLPALAGSLIAPMIYLIAARLYGWRAGLAAAGLVAISVWNITFSRFGMVSMFTVALDVAIYLCIVQAIRTGRLGYYAAGGVLLGLALQGYYVSRLVPIVLLVVLVHQLITNRMRLVRAIRVGAVVFVVGTIIGFLPLGTFAAQNWDTYNSRVSEASIFSPFGSGGNPDAFNVSFSKHILMFNWLGDANGRHNLPGRPMLDWVTAALFFAGLGTCILRAWRWQYFFPVVWFAAALSGGVLSLLFEAPQSHRTLENSVVTALIGGIFLGEVWQLVSRAFAQPSERAIEVTAQPAVDAAVLSSFPAGKPGRRLFPTRRPKPASTLPVRKHSGAAATLPVPTRPVGGVTTQAASTSIPSTPTLDPVEAERIISGKAEVDAVPHSEPAPGRRYSRRQAVAMIASAVSLLAVIGWIASDNIHRYFEVQAKDKGVWREMYTSETEAGRVVARYGFTHDVYVSPVYFNLPPSQYLAPDQPAFEWKGMYSLPLEALPGRDVVVVLDPQSAADIASLQRIYPNARFEMLRVPGPDPTPLVYTIFIPSSDLSALTGVHASLYDGAGGSPREEKTLPGLEYNWDSPGVKSGKLRMTSTLKVIRSQAYQFTLESAGGPSDEKGLLVDGYPMSAGTVISLGLGLHSIIVTDTVTTPKGITRVTWAAESAPPEIIAPTMLYDPRKIEPRGLTGMYRKGGSFDTPPDLIRVDPFISYYFQVTPVDRPYSAEWLGKLYIPQTGLYGLATEQITSSILFIDGKETLVNAVPNSTAQAQIDLSQGWHDIRLLYSDLENYSHMYLYWTPPGREQSIIPSAFLRPKMGQYVADESGPLPTIEESNGQKLRGERPTGAEPLPTQDPNTQPVTEQATALPGEPISPLLVLGDGSANILSGPFASTVDAAGNIYIYTDSDGKIHKFDPSGKEVSSWVVQDAEGKPLIEGSALLIKDSNLLLLDAATSELISFDFDGKLLGRTLLCTCYYPRGVSLARDGNFWVADTGVGRVVKVKAGGQELAVIGDRGSGPGQFIEPTSVWESPQGGLFVADVGNGRVQTFSADLKPTSAWSMGPSIAREGNRLVGMTEVGFEGNVLVTQAQDKAMVLYDQAGKELRRWTYTRDGVMLVPAGISQGTDGSYIVLYPKSNLGVVFKP